MMIVASNSFTVSNVNDGIAGPKGDTGSILGENMWIGYKYSYPGSTRIYPSYDHIQGINPIATQIFDDSTRFTFSDDYYIAHFQTNLYVIIDKQITTTVTHDDDLTIYCNDEVVVSKNSTIFTAYDITFNLKAGWNKIDILLHEISGGDQVTFGTKLSSLVEHLSYIKGNDGIAGKDGIGIKSTTITYQASTSGTTAPTGTWVASPTATSGQYQWTRTVWKYTDGTTEIGYSVGHIGANGANGQDGVAGKPGVGIKSTTITYATSTSGTSAPTSGWVSTPPTATSGQFVWTRTIWTYTDNTMETGYSVGKIGDTGQKGERGKQIFKSSYEGNPNQAGRYWSDLSPAPSVDNPPKIGDTVITPAGNIFQINAVTVGGGGGGGTFGVGDVLGNIKGDTGKDGLPGKDGVGITATAVTYQASTSGTTAPTGTWLTVPPTVTAGKFLWTRMIWTYTDGTTETGYSVGHIGTDGSDGLPGKPGADGRTPYFHQAWADSSDGNTNFSTTVSLGKKYLGTYTDYVVADSTDPTKYKWTELVGAIKIGGTNLLINTGYLGANWNGQFSVATTVGYNGYPSMMFTSSNRQFSSQTLALGKLQNSTQYTASFWAKANNTGDKAHTELWGAEGATDFVLTNDWVRYTAVLTSYSDANTNVSHSACYFGVPSGNKGNVYIALPKLEYGNKATDWSPAPEDNASASDLAKTNQTVSTVVTQTAKNWSVLAQGLGGKSAGISVSSDGTVDIAGDHVTIASDLIADDIKGKNITGSTFGNDSGTFSIDSDGNIKGASLNSPLIEMPFTHAAVDTDGPTYGSGFMSMSDATLRVDGTIDDSGQRFHVGVSPAGIVNNIYDTNGDLQSASGLIKGALWLYYANGGTTYGGYIDGQLAKQLNHVGELLWSGAWGMSASTTCTPSKPITDCLHGWEIWWSYGSTNAGINADWQSIRVSKAWVNDHNGSGVTSVLHTNSGGHKTQKYLYIGTKTLKGHDNNFATTSQAGGPADFVMREVRAW